MQKTYKIEKKYLVLLSLYGILSFLVFCFLLFPKEKVILHTLKLVSDRFNCQVSTQDLRLAFPGQLELTKVKIARQTGNKEPEVYLHFDKIQIKPKLSQILFKKIKFIFGFWLCGGSVKGTAYLDLFKPKNIKDVDCLIKDIQLSEIKPIQDMFNLKLSGKVSGQARLKSDQNNLLNGTGDYSFNINSGDVQFMNFPKFNFQQIKGEGNLSQGKVKIRSIDINGDDLEAQVSGDLRLDKIIARSYLNAKVQMNITQALRDKLGPLASFIPQKNKDGIKLNVKGNLNKLSYFPI